MEDKIVIYVNNLMDCLDNLLFTLIFLMIIDFITGIIKSVIGKSDKSKQGYLHSTIMWHGGIKKILTLSVIAVASVLNVLMLPETTLIRTLTITYYISVEALSVLENVAQCGLPIPKKVLQILENLKSSVEK